MTIRGHGQMSVSIEKIPGGFRVDGLELRNGKCGCTSTAKCCYTMSKVKKRGADTFEFNAKMSDPDTSDNFSWGYVVRKDGVTVTATVDDARDKTAYSGYFPPKLSDWEGRGWEVVERTGERADGSVWRCSMCKWLYKDDEQESPFEELPDDWKCPVCKAGKNSFEKIG
jgi:rubredoxin